MRNLARWRSAKSAPIGHRVSRIGEKISRAGDWFSGAPSRCSRRSPRRRPPTTTAASRSATSAGSSATVALATGHNNHGGGGGGGGGGDPRRQPPRLVLVLVRRARGGRRPPATEPRRRRRGGASGGASSRLQDLFSKLFGAGGSHPGPGKSCGVLVRLVLLVLVRHGAGRRLAGPLQVQPRRRLRRLRVRRPDVHPGGHQCDAKHQCPDGSDELGCDFECIISAGVDELPRPDGSCVAGERLCDGESNCADGSDELGCSFECVLPHGGQGHMCSDGRCIHSSYACDGEANCADGSDEMGCGFQCTRRTGAGEALPRRHLRRREARLRRPLELRRRCGRTPRSNARRLAHAPTPPLAHHHRHHHPLLLLRRRRGRARLLVHLPHGQREAGWQCADDAHTCVGGGQMCDGSSNCPNKDDELMLGLSCALVDGGFGFECRRRRRAEARSASRREGVRRQGRLL